MTQPSEKEEPRPLRELLGWEAAADADVPQATAPSAKPAADADAPTRLSDTPDANQGASVGKSPATPSPAGGAARNQPRRRPKSPAAARIAIVDGSNVAHAGEGPARLANVLAMREKLAAEGFEPIMVVDAALRHQIDDVECYERLVAEGELKQAPAGTDADYFILAFAKELRATIVSNDKFRDRSRLFADVRRRVIRYMIVAGEVVLERRTSRRNEKTSGSSE
jgi:hypothetical protein